MVAAWWRSWAVTWDSGERPQASSLWQKAGLQ